MRWYENDIWEEKRPQRRMTRRGMELWRVEKDARRILKDIAVVGEEIRAMREGAEGGDVRLFLLACDVADDQLRHAFSSMMNGIGILNTEINKESK